MDSGVLPGMKHIITFGTPPPTYSSTAVPLRITARRIFEAFCLKKRDFLILHEEVFGVRWICNCFPTDVKGMSPEGRRHYGETLLTLAAAPPAGLTLLIALLLINGKQCNPIAVVVHIAGEYQQLVIYVSSLPVMD